MVNYEKAYKRLSRTLTSDEQKTKLHKLLTSHKELDGLLKNIKFPINISNY